MRPPSYRLVASLVLLAALSRGRAASGVRFELETWGMPGTTRIVVSLSTGGARLRLHGPRGTTERACDMARTWPDGARTRALVAGIERHLPRDARVF